MSSPARRMSRPGSTSTRTATALVAAVGVLDPDTASAPSGTIAPVEIRIASPGAERALRRVPGARLADDREPDRRAVGGAAVSAARTA